MVTYRLAEAILLEGKNQLMHLEGMKVYEYHIGDNNNYYVTTAACARGPQGYLSHTLKRNQCCLGWEGVNPHFALMQVIVAVVASSHVGFVRAIARLVILLTMPDSAKTK